MAVRYRLGCELEYDIKEETTFIFNLEVAELERHHDLVEHLVVTPQPAMRRYVAPATRNRYLGLTAQPGPLKLTYEAEVTLSVHRADPATVHEIPIGELPLDILPFLLP